VIDKKYLDDIEHLVKDKLSNDFSGHDWWHIRRVIGIALKIANTEKCNKEKVYVTALLHDIFDEKIFKIDDKEKVITSFFKKSKFKKYLSEDEIRSITIDLLNMSFRGKFSNEKLSIEGKIVQDADRIDAIGAIGIARTFAYGGSKKNYIHNPVERKELIDNNDQISHFYVKLLHVKENLNTSYAKKIARKRHNFMVKYLEHFFAEWNDDFED